MWRMFFLLVVIALVGCATQNDGPRRAFYHHQIGTNELSRGNYPAALGELLRAKELDPKNAVIRNNLGLAYYYRGKPDSAETEFREALRLNLSFTEARNNLGRILIENGRYDDAIKELQLAVKDLVYASPEKSYSNLGLAYFKKKEYRSAEKYFLESLKLRRSDCTTLAYYGLSLYELSSFDQAAESLDKAVEACKPSPMEETFYYSALSYLKLGKRDQAVARLAEGLENFPKGQYSDKAEKMLAILK